ncbi:23S rRNA (guanosine(2251)-2'-O)-methyltransferase RlmB [Flavobacteriaceae bacterium]|jgi:23S rRNA (guanosine2251-2'-O)-methyltransferase|nr:23S rRNA (guanosine(2251)-2'-O)-methyltransferase RlmB [Bacteroidota bacterium]MDA9215840.1 23S rRNA (guanosine(2251)-2'-O)-methyltransferase RlmB [Flavobacteriaceae bacterium]MDB2631053.1 23S rRNA (guanosine(2251)-2'-O)-methyltransferase RlmB [Ulvibacter sp.]MDA9239145.1 23S rRNA (guanosine(2251)-2'-O)-methyltransferase RlmB [Flavobacteriaceae bacterium]MDA9310082.1 23S rRNA (guanosine(2251)-2'-O)-methyltransferase RlmB [Flavobacteriaceae bacterium]|tara:strand:+ start:258 stop:995 length:738 start_codon:yes stop_codon:yes gene_type:complete
MKKETLLFGIYPVIEALKAKQTIDKAYVQKGLQSPKIDAIVADLEALNTTISYVPLEKMEKLCRSNHQGIILISSPIEFVALETMVEAVLESEKTPLFLILDQISDVRNFGAILRTAECTGVDGVIIQKKGGAPVSGDTVKTSAGAIFNIPICKVDHIKDAIYYLQGSGITTIAATEKTQDTIYNLELNEPMAIVMGSEGLGVSKSVLSIVDKKASLPLLGVINSLNVSVACGALLYEVVRQRSK